MTTTFPVDNRTILSEVDGVGGWTATDGPTLFTTGPTPMEATGCLGMQVSNAVEDAYITITSDDWSNGTFSMWVQDRAEFDTTANVGIGLVVGDGTNRIAYAVGGSDGTGFRHDTGPVKWTNFVLDLGNKPVNFVAIAGSEASLNEAAITQCGIRFDTLVKSVGGTDNCFFDIMRWANPGDDVVMQGGTTAGTAGNGSEAAAVDRGTGNQQAYGVIRELANGVYGIQGNLTIGNTASATDQYWEETNVTYAWEDRGLSTTNYYRFNLIGRTGQTSSIIFNTSTFSVPAAASAAFDGNGANLDTCTMNACTFIGFDQGIQTSDASTDNWTNCTYIGNDEVVANGCDISGSSFSEYTGAANGACLTYDLNTDPDGELDNLTFEKTSGTAHHAIDFGSNIPTTSITLRGCAFGTDFSASENTSPTAEAGDETFAFRDTTGTLTVNLIDCTGNFGYYSAGVEITIVADPVTTEITAVDENGSPLLGARVLLEAADATGPLPYLETITITSSGTTATASHTAHGIPDGKKVVIRGADQSEYNGVFTINVTGVNSYEYTMSGDPVDTATGTITASGVVIEGLTDSSGTISESRTWSSSQPITGWARKATGTPRYKTFPISGTVSNTTGFSANIMLIRDD